MEWKLYLMKDNYLPLDKCFLGIRPCLQGASFDCHLVSTSQSMLPRFHSRAKSGRLHHLPRKHRLTQHGHCFIL